MAKRTRQEILWAQNFLIHRKRVRRLIQASSIGPEDIVYEIGAGHGIITAELARIAGKVVALEIDPALADGLRRRFQNVSNIEIRTRDFLACQIREEEYKIFANIPYNRTADIVRKILQSVPVPKDVFLVVQKEAGEKISGSPKESRFSVLAKPFYRIRILLALHRTDFAPIPNVDSVLLQIQRRDPPLVSARDAALYRGFVGFGFGVWKNRIKLILKPLFSYCQWKRLSQDLQIPPDATPSELSFEQWLGLFDFFKEEVSMAKRRVLVK